MLMIKEIKSCSILRYTEKYLYLQVAKCQELLFKGFFPYLSVMASAYLSVLWKTECSASGLLLWLFWNGCRIEKENHIHLFVGKNDEELNIKSSSRNASLKH